jgi:hypothetical protein
LFNNQNQDESSQTLKPTSLYAQMNSFNAEMGNVLTRNCFVMSNKIVQMVPMKLPVEWTQILTEHLTVILANVSYQTASALLMVPEFLEILTLLRSLK